MKLDYIFSVALPLVLASGAACDVETDGPYTLEAEPERPGGVPTLESAEFGDRAEVRQNKRYVIEEWCVESYDACNELCPDYSDQELYIWPEIQEIDDDCGGHLLCECVLTIR